MRLITCEPFEDRLNETFSYLQESGFEIDSANNGRDAQKLLSENAYEVCLINIALSSFSALEVIKFIQTRGIKTRIILLADSETALDERVYDRSIIKKMGVGQILIRPFTKGVLEKEIKGRPDHFAVGKPIPSVEDSASVDEEVEAFDDKFTSVDIFSFFCGNLAIFDLYLRLGRNKYVKVFNQGEPLSQTRLERYANEKQAKLLYFKTSDRRLYINYVSDMVKRLTDNENISEKTKTKFVRTMGQKIIEEVYTKGLNQNSLADTANLCDSIHENIKDMKGLNEMFEELMLYEDQAETHAFLTAVYSDIISKSLDWITDHSRPKILMGAMLHDIGKLKLPVAIRSKKPSELSGESLLEYQKHCLYGVELLDRVPKMGEQIKQIVFQHHELMNGEGFPYGVSGVKIYPPAKIVAFANKVAELSISRREPPIEIIKFLIQDKEDIFNYDSDVVKAFIKSFMEKSIK